MTNISEPVEDAQKSPKTAHHAESVAEDCPECGAAGFCLEFCDCPECNRIADEDWTPEWTI